ncbi:hypothetical protein, partial [Desulfatiferula olefinivorans]
MFEEQIRLGAGFPDEGPAFVHFGLSRDHAAIDLKNDLFHFPFDFTVFHDPPPVMGFCRVALLYLTSAILVRTLISKGTCKLYNIFSLHIQDPSAMVMDKFYEPLSISQEDTPS